MSLERLADLLRSRGLSWTFRASGGTCESIVRGPGDSHVYAVNSVSIEHAIGRTIAALLKKSTDETDSSP